MGLRFLGWNPWSFYGGVGTLGWNPWGFSATGAPTAAMVRAVAKGQETVLAPGSITKYVAEDLDQAAAYEKWSFDVRMSLLVVEFLGKVTLEFDTAKHEASVKAMVNGTLSTIIVLTAPSVAEINDGASGLNSTQDRHPADSADIDLLVAQNEGIDAFMLRCAGAVPELHGAKYELARATSILVNLVCLRLKHAFAVKRPSELDTSIVPMLPVPGHASFPGGHATMASALALVVAATVKGAPYKALKTLAEQIALNRVRAGLHYQLDSDAGHRLGEALGAYLVATLADDAKKTSDRDRTLPMLGVVWHEALCQ